MPARLVLRVDQVLKDYKQLAMRCCFYLAQDSGSSVLDSLAAQRRACRLRQLCLYPTSCAARGARFRAHWCGVSGESVRETDLAPIGARECRFSGWKWQDFRPGGEGFGYFGPGSGVCLAVAVLKRPHNSLRQRSRCCVSSDGNIAVNAK